MERSLPTAHELPPPIDTEDDIVTMEKQIAILDTPGDHEIIVESDQPHDNTNPKDWPTHRKWIATMILSTTGLNRIMVSTIMAPALTKIAHELHMNSVEAVMSMSVYLLATAFGPLAIGPLTEIYGRAPVLHVTNIWFFSWNLMCGFAHNKGLLLAARFLAGFGASAIYALSGGVLADIWLPEERGKSLGLYGLISLLGAAIGPIIGGFITQDATWRWMFWSTSILQAVFGILSLLLFRESHGPTILLRKAKRLRKITGDDRYRTAGEKLESGRSVLWVFQRSMSRPIRLLMFHPIVQVQACLAGFMYGLLYLGLTSFSILWTTQYHESVAISGLHYISLCLGELVGAEAGGPLMDFIYAKLRARANGVGRPEFHIVLLVPAAFLTPFGLLLYGWCAEKRLPWIAVDIGAFLYALGMQIITTTLRAYVIDSYPDHAGSASAATQLLSSLAAFGFPLFTPKMYDVLGYGWGNTVVALVAIAITLPAPALLWLYGPGLRAKAQSSY